MRFVVRLFFGTVAGAILLLAVAGNANAQVPPSVGLKPSSGPAGSSFTISWNGFPTCRIINFFWAGTSLGSKVAPATSGSFPTAVPAGAKPGSYTVTATCTSQKETASGTFVVTGVTTTTPPPVTTTPVTPPPATTTPTRPGTTTTPPTTTTTPPTTTTTPPSSTTPTTPGTPATTSSTEPKPGELVLDRPSVQPGDELSASGKGCEPSRMVTLTSDGMEVGSAYADASGAFTAPVEFTRIEAGRHTVIAECGVRLTGAVDQVVTRSSGGQTGTLVILVFFVLAGMTAVRFR
ncbi:Uncharacterised protein [Amycolatopsis camponoti]|uniref:Bacterial Ig-like domain-containing protein n=2 Tax=Amycolatopsis camponoti TaxID=2606593 RepID=A0A6I8LF79_9PSEU|nr:Uncharacterised protein [Amycolatopsis camponoti]